MAEPISDWKTLELGQHVKLSCGCAGFIVRVDREPPKDCDEDDVESNTGFVMTYTSESCLAGRSNEKAYRNGYGPFSNYFNYDMKTSYMPAEPTEPPAWWSEVAKLRGWPEKPAKYPFWR
jgi:hypothetical protein